MANPVRTPNSALGRTFVAARVGVEPETRYRRSWLRAAKSPAVALVLTYLIFVVATLGKRIDALAFAGRLDSGRGLLGLDHVILQLISAPTTAIGLLGIVLGAQLVGRREAGIRCVIAVAGAVITAELLKGVLPVSDSSNGWTLGAGTFPSGHVTIAAAFSLAGLSLLPGRWRHQVAGPLVAWVVLVATSTVTARWHRPSDALGGAILSLGWHRAVLSGSASRKADMPRPFRGWTLSCLTGIGKSRLTAVLWVSGVALVIVFVALMSPPSSSESRAELDPSLYLGAIVVVAIAVSVVVLVGYARPVAWALNDGHLRRTT